MEPTAYRAIAIVGVGAVLPDAANVDAFWQNVKQGRYSISDVSPARWDPALYFDSDHSAPDKTYSKIGGWVREWKWEPAKWRLPIPPRVVDAMDEAQRWAIACTREALEDFGYPERPLDTDRTAVILGNAMAGEKHYLTALRVYFPEYARQLSQSASFAALPDAARRDITRELHDRIAKLIPGITEDTMPGELANCIAGRIANVFNFHGPNYVVDAACASAMAAISSAAEGLVANDFDVAITGGIDRNMGASTYVKFSKIGALSASGTRPYAEGADGFVMGEGAAIFVLKRLADAERDGDKVYAVLRGIGGASDGKGKGITAPNPVGQKLAIERAWQNAGVSPATVTLMEGHGTSTSVGDLVEVQSMDGVLSSFHLPVGSVALGSVKSNIGHLKGAAGAAGLLKAALALRDKVLPPSVHCEHPNPNVDFAHSPLYVNTELKPWNVPADGTRRAGVSAFGFGGTNFHLVLEEFIPHKLTGNGKRLVAVAEGPAAVSQGAPMYSKSVTPTVMGEISRKAPLRGALVIGAASEAELVERLRALQKAAGAGDAPPPVAPADSDLRAVERLAIDYADAADLAIKSANALKALKANQAPIWKALRPQGIFRGHGPAGKVAFLYTGQGSQYVNMLAPLRAAEPIVAELFDEADRIMTPLLGKPLTDYIFVDQTNADAVAKAEEDLRQTEITQPTVLTIDLALTRMLAAFGIRPDMTMGHSLGEYGALVASGSLTFENALAAVSARGRGMTQVAVADKGKMAAVFAPLAEVERILKTINDYVVIANINSGQQSVIGGASHAVEQATEIFLQAGFNVVPLPVSHAFHTSIVAPASEPLREMLSHLHMQSPRVPVVANVTGEFYPTGPDVVPQMLDLLAKQVACPVQFVKGLRTLYDAGARIFIEVGPKKALQGFAEEVLGDRGDVVTFFSNHPKVGDIVSFNQALCGLYAAGLGCEQMQTSSEISATVVAPATGPSVTAAKTGPVAVGAPTSTVPKTVSSNGDRYNALGHLFADVLDKASEIYRGQSAPKPTEPVAITGAAVGLPGTEHIFDDGNVARILRGDQFIKSIPSKFRTDMLDKRITRLVKSESGEARFDTIEDVADVIKLAGRGGAFDLEKEFGISAERLAALDRVTQLAIAVGIDAMRDAGIPLIMRYKTTSKGTQLPDRWGLPDAMRDDTGVIMGSAFPGYDAYADEMARYYADHARREQLASLESMVASVAGTNGHSALAEEIVRKIEDLRAEIEKNPYIFDRRFLLKTLSMGHSQFAEFIGARGPNTQINSACATTSHAISLAEDWIRAGRCSRVIIITADDVTSDHMIGWFGAGFLASGAAATDELVEEAATPFDRRRHGLIMGMGAAALVVESAQAARERGIQPICEVLSAVTANSAFHGTRLDVQHIGQVMEGLIAQAEAHSGIERHQIAPHTVFVSHETYTPARGGSASAEIHALRRVFGNAADQIVIANTKGLTGHAMATGIEEVLAVKALETGVVPPVANFKEIDPELGALNLSKGGDYPIEYALRLGAGFGSQISMSLLRWVPNKDGVHRSANDLGYAYRIVDKAAWDAWLSKMAGHPAADLEVVNRTLRVSDRGLSARVTEVAREVKSLAVPVPTIQTVATAPAPSAQIPVKPSKPAVVAPKPSPSPTQTQPVKVETQVPVVVAAAPVTQPPPVLAGESVKDRVLALVAEKTGYPIDMLDLELDLEADLGVDTVKQAEVFATIREAYGIARDDQIKLRDYPTIAHVIRFVNERRPNAVVAAAPAVVGTEQKEASKVTAPTPPAIPAQTGAGNAVQERILDLAVEKTGYPRDMLDLDLDLEADLGVDTVKQAEMFAAIREIYSIPRDESRKLRDYPTLAHVIRFVYEKRPDLAPGVTPAPVTVATAAKVEPTVIDEVTPPAPLAPIQAVVEGESVKERILTLMAEKTGYPKDMLDLELDLEADLGVDTVKQAEMFAAVREIYNIPRDENRKLRDYPTLAHVIRFVYEKRPDLAPGVTPAPVTVATAAKVEPTVTAAVAASAPVTPVQPVVESESVKERILTLMAEKTGYPKDMLDLELDLEADLGVDTVKQAEMFAAVREIYNIPRDESRKLRDYPTLAHVIRFVYEKRPDLAPGVPPAPPPVEVPAATEPIVAATTAAPAPAAARQVIAEDDSVKERILTLMAEKTGYPKDMLDLELDLEADLGVDTVKQAEMFAAVREIYNIPRDENRKLRDYPTLAHVIRFVYENRPDLAQVTPTTPTAVAPTAAPAATATPAAVVQRASDDAIKEKVLEIVAEKTGYPKDMLDLDLDLEADLGVDTVKQAEMFASVRAAYNIPREENLKLRDFPTLAHVIQFARDKQNSAVTLVVSAPAVVTAPAAVKPISRPRPPLASFDAANKIPRRVPVPNLRPPLNICKPTEVTLGPGSRVVVMPDKAGVAEVLTQRLQSMGVEVLALNAAQDANALTECLKNWLSAGPIQGVYWLPALDNEGPLSEMDLNAWHAALQLRVKSLYATMRVLYEQIAKPDTFLVSATRLGGQHGYDGAGAVAPLGGAVVGFTKTYKRERTETLVKSVDFEAERTASEVAEAILEETLRDPGAVEIGYKNGLRWTVGLQEQPVAVGQHGLTLDQDSVFLITGAAGSIVSAITADLAAASGGTFYLLDLVPTPDPNNPDLARFVSDKEGLKRDLFERMKARGERATPALVEKELAALERAQAAQSAIDAVSSAGGTPHYFSINLTDSDGVTNIINQVRQRSGRIDVLLHAAGIERSHFLPDKDQREFELVFDVKSDGWFNLLHAIGDMPLGATVAFSSIAGRFGNAGQSDYSSANDLLCKITSSFRTTRPATRGIVIDWTAWGGIGMATRGSIPKMMELAGIDMLPPEAGIPMIRRELTSAETRGELIVAQRLGVMLNEWDETGGLDTQALAALLGKQTPAQGPMVGKITGMTLSGGLTMETTLDPAAQAFLYDHRIDGTPVLPGVMGIEAFAEAALCVHPGWHIEAIEEVNFLAPFKFYRDEPRTVFIQAHFYPQGERLVADCRLVGRRTLPNQAQPQETIHFTARVRVTKQAPVASAGLPVRLSSEGIVDAAGIYRIYFHGPAYQVLDHAWRDGERIVGQMSVDLPGDHNPSQGPTLIGPRLIELCFQTAGLLEISEHNRMGLPLYVHQLSWSHPPELAEGPLFAVVTPDTAGEKFDAEVVDTQGNRYLRLTGYRTVTLPDSVDAEPLHALQNVTA
jgi:acyl transferase domain-containing protein/acyl carrier protein/NAD(P)-dependent dehydrogenase (short-subunit alcohol dehydrogenase family)